MLQQRGCEYPIETLLSAARTLTKRIVKVLSYKTPDVQEAIRKARVLDGVLDESIKLCQGDRADQEQDPQAV
jgi:hypothetical protein